LSLPLFSFNFMFAAAQSRCQWDRGINARRFSALLRRESPLAALRAQNPGAYGRGALSSPPFAPRRGGGLGARPQGFAVVFVRNSSIFDKITMCFPQFNRIINIDKNMQFNQID
jgi:hypothetical protein